MACLCRLLRLPIARSFHRSSNLPLQFVAHITTVKRHITEVYGIVAVVLMNKIRNVFPPSSILVIISECGIPETLFLVNTAVICLLNSDFPGYGKGL